MKRIFILLLLFICLLGFKTVQAEEQIYDYIYLDVKAVDKDGKLIPDSCGSIIQEEAINEEEEFCYYLFKYIDTNGNEYILNSPGESINTKLIEYFYEDNTFVSKVIYIINGNFAIRNNLTYISGIFEGLYQQLPDMIILKADSESIIDDVEYYNFYCIVLNNQFLKNDYKEVYIKKTDIDSSLLDEKTLAIRFGQFVKCDFNINYKTIKVNARGSYSLYPYLVDGEAEYHPYFYLNFVDENGDDIPIDTIVGIKFKYQLFEKTPIFGIKHGIVNYTITYQSNQITKSDLNQEFKWYDAFLNDNFDALYADYTYLFEKAQAVVPIKNYDLKPSFDDENVNPNWEYVPIIKKFDKPIEIKGVKYNFGICEKSTLLYCIYISEEDFSVIELTYSYNDIIYHYEGDEIINSPTIPLDPNPEGEYSLIEKILNAFNNVWNWINSHIYLIVIILVSLIGIKFLPLILSLFNKKKKR